ncbi:hypothetical protein [Rhizobium sp. IMFF44]|uniref:hypothetical protein n=1 Tax=Rhizobium sp. IMFF44 TaxID=3342350 RepID=UPI0035B77AB1
MAGNGSTGPRKPSGRSRNGQLPPNNSTDGVDGQIIPPSMSGEANGAGTNIYAKIAADIKQYTDRPDLLLEAIERHDPGFIKRMNDEAREFQSVQRKARFTFGKWQAYASLFVQVVSALALLGVLFVLAYKDTLAFWSVLGLALFYAISQSGLAGFRKIVDHIISLFKHADKKGGK